MLYELGIRFEANVKQVATQIAAVAVSSKKKKSWTADGQKPNFAEKDETEDVNKCEKCGLVHIFGKCPAASKTCISCVEKGHFVARCPHKKVKEESTTKVEGDKAMVAFGEEIVLGF